MKKDSTRTGASLCSSMRPRSATTSWLNKFKLLALVLTTMLSVNSVWGAEGDYTSADFSSWETSYATYSSTEWSDNGCTFTYAANNNKAWAYLAVGGKTTATSIIKNNTKFTVPISKVTINISGITNGSSSSITLNSITATAYSNSTFTTQVGEKSITGLSYDKNSIPSSIDIIPTTNFPANSWIKVSIGFTCTGTKNSRIQVTSIDYYEGSSGPTTYTLTYAAGGGSGTGPAQASNLEAGDKVTLAANTFTAPSGKKFNGWNDGTSTYNAGVQYTMPSKNVTMTAQWTSITYTDLSSGQKSGQFQPS